MRNRSQPDMKPFTTIFILALSCAPLSQTETTSSQENKLGLFEKNGDIGAVKLPGSVEYDDAKKSYTIAGGGENMWAATDAFHYVWKRVSGDLSIAADVQFVGAGGNPHRKACLIIRQSLDPDSAYADAALHGDGLTSLQYREIKGGPTREIQSNMKAPRRVQDQTDRAVLCRPRRLRARQQRHREGSFLERRDQAAPAADSRKLAGDRFDFLQRSPRGPHQTRTLRSAQLVARRKILFVQPGRAHLQAAGQRRQTATSRHRLRHALQQRPRRLARRLATRH